MNATKSKTEEKSLDELIYDNLDSDNLHSRETIEQYIIDMIKRGIIISHMLKQLEEYRDTDYFYVDLSCSLNELVPIDSVEDFEKVKERL